MKSKPCTVRTGVIGPHARTLELPLLVRPAMFFFSPVSAEGGKPGAIPPSYPKKGILNVLA